MCTTYSVKRDLDVRQFVFWYIMEVSVQTLLKCEQDLSIRAMPHPNDSLIILSMGKNVISSDNVLDERQSEGCLDVPVPSGD